MPDTILDDVNALLLMEKGDRRILEQIRRAAEHGEVISVYERNYVAKLKGEFIEKRPRPAPRSHAQVSGPAKPALRPVPVRPQQPGPPRRKSPRRTRIIAGAGGAAALIAIAAIGVYMSGLEPGGTAPGTPVSDSLASLDEESYALGDIISISGRSDSSLGSQAVLSIENPASDLVWTESVSLKSSGAFSTLAIAGGTGWSDPGTYTLVIEHGGKTESIDFTFQG